MERAIVKHLSALKRLGKIERQELRSVLTTDAYREQFRTSVELIIFAHAEADDGMLEDLFIFGAQIADIWTGDEITLEVEQITRALCAFSAGFNGGDFTEVFSGRLMRELQEQWANSIPAKPDAIALTEAQISASRNFGNLSGKKRYTKKRKMAEIRGSKLAKRAHSVVVQRNAECSATA